MAFKLEHLQPVKPILFRNFSNFWLWYLKLTAYGIQTGPFVACWANFVWKFFHLFILILGSQCLWHSNLTICSMLSQFCSEMFQTFDFDTWSSLPKAFKLEHLQPVEPILFWNFSDFWLCYLGLTAHGIQSGPFAARGANFVQKIFKLLILILGSHCPCNSNWTICSPWSQFCSEIFQTFDFDTWSSLPMAFKLDHFQPVEPILFWNFSNFWLWYLKLTAYGIQTGPFVACWANFVWKFFHLFILILGSQCLWHSNLTICSMLSQFCSEMFQTFDFDTWSSLPIAFKLDHLQPVEPILFWNVSNFWLWYLKLTAYCIQTWPFVACWANFVRKFFYLFILILGSQCLWHSYWIICSLLSLFSGNWKIIFLEPGTKVLEVAPQYLCSIFFRESRPCYHFQDTGKSFSGNWKVIFWEPKSHFLGTWKKPCYHFQDAGKSFSGNRKVIF